MKETQDYTITSSKEYNEYLAALCRLASEYVSRIRVQFAEKAYEKYADETIRRLVLAYGEEAEKLDKQRLSDFKFVAAKYTTTTEDDSLDDFCLNHARSYADAIRFLFDLI